MKPDSGSCFPDFLPQNGGITKYSASPVNDVLKFNASVHCTPGNWPHHAYCTCTEPLTNILQRLGLNRNLETNRYSHKGVRPKCQIPLMKNTYIPPPATALIVAQ